MAVCAASLKNAMSPISEAMRITDTTACESSASVNAFTSGRLNARPIIAAIAMTPRAMATPIRPTIFQSWNQPTLYALEDDVSAAPPAIPPPLASVLVTPSGLNSEAPQELEDRLQLPEQHWLAAVQAPPLFTHVGFAWTYSEGR